MTISFTKPSELIEKQFLYICDREEKAGREIVRNNYPQKNMEEFRERNEQDQKYTRDASCFFALIKEFSERWTVNMMIYANGESPVETVIDNGEISLDGEKLNGQQARKFVARHKADLERLLFEAAKAHSEEKEYCRSLQIASIADKAGEKGTSARIIIRDGEYTRILQIGRNGDIPVFMIDGRKADKEEAVSLIRDNYEQFAAGLHEAEKAIRNHYRERKETGRKRKDVIAIAQNGKITVDLDKMLPARAKGIPDLKSIRKATGKHFDQKNRSHLN